MPPLLCPVGSVCENGGAAIPCNAGTYSSTTGLWSQQQCLLCPAGYYCPSGNNPPIPCPVGFYNSHFGMASAEGCLLCPPAFICDEEGEFEPHKWCREGYYCPRGTHTPFPCPAGSIGDSPFLVSPSQCLPCFAGMACTEGTAFSFAPPLACEMGYYCPEGTRFPTEFPCPPGTYGESTSLTSVTECTPCSKGYFCLGGSARPSLCNSTTDVCGSALLSTQGVSCPEGFVFDIEREHCMPCPRGKYCNRNFTSAQMCERGTFGTMIGLSVANDSYNSPLGCQQCPAGTHCLDASAEPTLCLRGFYSSEGDGNCHTCLAGYFCPEIGTTIEAMKFLFVCPPGYACAEGLDRHPRFKASAICPAHHYCPLGSSSPIPCPSGFSRRETGGKESFHCLPALPGIVSEISGRNCSMGHFCPEGTPEDKPVACPPGMHRTIEGGRWLADCLLCSAGHFCPGESVEESCPAGNYCGEGFSFPMLCPIGTYNPFTERIQLEDCLTCPAGFVCSIVGATKITDGCLAGFYCSGGATQHTPRDGITGNICPRGHYCPSNSSFPLRCPRGMYANTEGQSLCTVCPPFTICPFEGMETFSSCPVGGICNRGAIEAMDILVSPGYFANSNALQPIPCSPGTFTRNFGQIGCLPCPSGFYCNIPAMSRPLLCPYGAYCPNEGNSNFFICPTGTFNPYEGAQSLEECLPCPAGKFCQNKGLRFPSGECLKGFICRNGSVSAAPTISTASGGPCPAGHYCEEGTLSPSPCSKGMFLPYERATSNASCIPCLPGKYRKFDLYCASHGLALPTGDCMAGYYCDSESALPSPFKGRCPLGSFCEEGAITALPCPPGTFNNETGSHQCYTCPAGYICPEGSFEGNFSNIRQCPAGAICPSGTFSELTYRCPPGTYNPFQGKSQLKDCLPCLPGMYCLTYGLSSPTDNCSEGYACTGGATTSAPISMGCTYEFPILGMASLLCSTITSNYTNKNEAEIACNDIEACTGIVSFNSNTLWMPRCGPWEGGVAISDTFWFPRLCGGGRRCPKGTFCPSGSVEATVCTVGNYCENSGSGNISGVCAEGFYCPKGSLFPTSEPCPAGFYCLKGSRKPLPCPPGTFLSIKGGNRLEMCESCPRGQYCSNAGLAFPSGLCLAGYACPLGSQEGSPSAFICKKGTYCPKGTVEMLICEGGSYQDIPGQGRCKACPAGFYCPRGAIKQTRCPRGYFCPPSTPYKLAFPCPPGTFNPEEGGKSEATACQLCVESFYCPFPGLSYPMDCPSGYYCPIATKFPIPCDLGSYCPANSAHMLSCPLNYYCQEKLLSAPTRKCYNGHLCISNNVFSAPQKTSNVLINKNIRGERCPRGLVCII
ncbi:PAN domain-containing protein, partial [Cardiosporidium cionae]